jgi:hypothetical protein
VPSPTLSYDGDIRVTIPYDESLLESGSQEADIRFLHYNNEGVWEDRTISINTTANTVTGELDPLSPVVPALVNDGTFGPVYFDSHPLERVIDVSEDNGNSSTGPGPILVSSNSTALHSGDPITITNTIKNLQRTSQQYDYIIEILDKNNVAIELMTKSGTVDSGQSIKISQDWLAPKESGIYTIRIFVVQGLHEPAPILLKNSTSTEISVAS